MIKNCPCENCKFYTYGKDFGNYIELHYCERLKKSIVQHRGNSYHSSGTWIIPCGKDMYFFKKKSM